jgi:hypothetical protein
MGSNLEPTANIIDLVDQVYYIGANETLIDGSTGSALDLYACLHRRRR